MHQSIIVLDDVLPDPDAVRDQARQADFPVLDRVANFPGRNTAGYFGTQGLDQIASRTVGQALAPLPNTSHGKFRLTLADDVGLGKVHLDNSHWSGILYLTPDAYASGGTIFYRHKATGLESSLLTPSVLETQGWDTRERGEREINRIVERDTNDDSCWEETMRVSMRYNRLLLMRPWLWHTAGPGFGSSFEDGRLVFLLFYQLQALAKPG